MSTAVIFADFQHDLLDSWESETKDAMLAASAAVLEGARAAGLPVFFVRVAFRAGHPEIAESNKLFRGLKAAGVLVDGTPGADILDCVAPRADEPVIAKRRISAFAGSDLDALLRGHGVAHIALAGYSTSGVVLSTARQAADLDLRVTVLSDCCADRNAEAHSALMEHVFPKTADVVTGAEFLGSL